MCFVVSMCVCLCARVLCGLTDVRFCFSSHNFLGAPQIGQVHGQYHGVYTSASETVSSERVCERFVFKTFACV